jgi:hypothetical protein
MANRQLTQPDDWEDITDWEDAPEQPVVNTPTPEQPSMLSSAWDAISSPLWEGPSRFAKSVSEYMQPSNDASPLQASLQGFAQGATEGVGDLLSSFTSPIDLATTALSGGSSMAMKAGLPAIAKGLSMGGKAAGGLTALHGAGNVLSPESSMAERGMGLAEMAGGVAGMHHTPSPKLAAIGESVKTGAPPVTAESFGPGFFKGGGPEKAAEIAKGVAKKVEPPVAKTPEQQAYIDKYEKLRAVPVGTKYTVSASSMTRKQLTDAIKLGFNYEELAGDGSKIVMRKVKESPQPMMPEPPELEQSAFMDALNVPRTIMASMDMSAPLRQGIGLIHKKEFWNSLPDMFRAWGSEDAYNAIQKGITDDPIFKKRVSADGTVKPSFAEDVGLKLTDLKDMSTREESMMSKMVEKYIPGVRRSNRAYTAFLNKLRADTFKQMTKDFGVVGGKNMRNNVKVGREIADFVNNATGRGDLHSLESSAKALSTVLFSPRLIASRLNMMAKGGQALFSPEVYMLRSPSVRREYLKSLAAIAGTAGTFTQLMRLGGATVETDPASSDFGKPKIGNTRIDPYGGFQQYVVAMQRLMPQVDLSAVGLGEIGGKMKSTTTGREYDLVNPQFGQSTQADVLNRFIRSKTNPIINFGWGMLAGQKEISGQKMELANPNPMENAIAQRFLPMLMQDVYELINDEVTPPQAKALAAFLSSFGMGSQTYGGRQ